MNNSCEMLVEKQKDDKKHKGVDTILSKKIIKKNKIRRKKTKKTFDDQILFKKCIIK